jgi:Tfp pilus assembly protein PilF
MHYHYDNSAANPRNPNSPPKRVMAGNQATDEMGHLWLQVLPRGAGDHRLQIQEALMRHRLQKYPDDFSAHMNLGALMLSRLDTQDAVPMLRAAVKIDPKRADAHDMLGTALENVGRLQEGIAQFRVALQVQPTYLNAHYSLATALVKSGHLPEAVEQFRPVIAAYADSPRLQNQFGEMLAEEGKTAEALAHFDKAIALDPSYSAARQNRDLVSHRGEKH